MICLDNSEWMRNGDYTPTRMEAMHDAANLICGSKTQQNPENTVGVLALAGGGEVGGVRVLTSPTTDMGQLLSSCSGIKVGGKSNFAAGLRIAQLALKHRKNKNGGQRVIVFVGSPVDIDEKALTKIAKQMKKSNVAVDVVSMGESEANAEKLTAFIDCVNKNDNSHLIEIPAGVLPSDVLITSPIVTGQEGSAGNSSGGGMFAEYGGVDPNLDPELALALRVSMEEARAEAEKWASEEQKRVDTASGETNDGDAAASSSSSAAPGEAAAAPSSASANEIDEEDEALQRALAMSMMDVDEEKAEVGKESDSDKKEELKRSESPVAAGGAAGAAAFLDPTFVSQLLSGLPGVDMSDPQIQAAMASLGTASTGQQEESEDTKKDEEKDEEK